MRKLTIGLVALLFIGIVYYVTTGKAQLAKEIKKHVNTNLILLQEKGFVIDNRKIDAQSEYFELDFNDTKQISHFFTSQNISLTAEDVQILKGLKLAIKVDYLPTAYASASFDIFPLKFPSSWISETDNKEENILTQILKNKMLQLHLEINKLANGFKGTLEDIDETFKVNNKAIYLSLHTLNFGGELKDSKLQTFSQSLKTLSIESTDELNITLSNLNGTYKKTGESAYDYTDRYAIDTIKLSTDTNLILDMQKVTLSTFSTVKDTLLSMQITSTIQHIYMTHQHKNFSVEAFNFTSKVDNLDIIAIEALQNIDPDNQKVLDALLEKLLSKGVHFAIADISAMSLTVDKQKVDGFQANAHIAIDKALPFKTLQNNPMSALPYIDAHVKLKLSPTLLDLIAMQPQAMLAMMMFQPQDIKGQKVYEIEIKDGKALLNNKPLF